MPPEDVHDEKSFPIPLKTGNDPGDACQLPFFLAQILFHIQTALRKPVFRFQETVKVF
jgi:hypothetical protein